MNKIFKTIFALFTLVATIFTISATPLSKVDNTEKWFVVGNSGTAWALAREVTQNPLYNATMFVRNKDKVAKSFTHEQAVPNIVKGDVISDDITQLRKAAAGAKYIVIAQAFPYKIWEQALEKTIENCALLAEENNATLIFYARKYSYGHTKLISESTLRPNDEDQPSFQGKVLSRLEKRIEDLGNAGVIKTRIIRHSFPFGPNINDGLLDKNFSGIPHNATKGWLSSTQKWDWVGSDKIALQFTYTPDLAKFTIQYVEHEKVKTQPYATINFAGLSVANIGIIGEKYSAFAGEPYKKNIYSKTKLSLAAGVNPNAKRAKDVYYAFENEILLDDTARRELFDFKLTPLHQALLETYQWYTA